AKSFRSLLHSGELVRVERPTDPGTTLFGVVAADRGEALFALVRSATALASETPPLRFAGIDPGAHYQLSRIELPGTGPRLSGVLRSRPGADAVSLPGTLLSGPGAPAPFVQPDGAALFHLLREP
ncbi:MAG TPA: hypothetical protein VME46_08095, partial [Acidimicrobiales bacterium]|nr:hypothetical protein [Acidimicrobiales bacterium]